MKKCELSHNKCWGFLITALGAFFLVANLVPGYGMLRYWPIFLIAAGLMRMHCGCCFKGDRS